MFCCSFLVYRRQMASWMNSPIVSWFMLPVLSVVIMLCDRPLKNWSGFLLVLLLSFNSSYVVPLVSLITKSLSKELLVLSLIEVFNFCFLLGVLLDAFCYCFFILVSTMTANSCIILEGKRFKSLWRMIRLLSMLIWCLSTGASWVQLVSRLWIYQELKSYRLLWNLRFLNMLESNFLFWPVITPSLATEILREL